MNRLLALTLVAVSGLLSAGAQAAPVTIDFEEFNLGDGPTGSFYPYSWFESQGYEFNGNNGPCGQYGCPPEIVMGASGSKSLGASNGFNGQDGYGAQVYIEMRKADGGAFAIHSLDLLLQGCVVDNVSCGGSEYIVGTLAGGGSANLAVPVGTGDWLNLQYVQFVAGGDCCGFGTGTVVQVDNINVSAVPIPAAVWLFASALAGLGWLRRRQTV